MHTMQHILFTGVDSHIASFVALLAEFIKFYLKNITLDLYIFLTEAKNFLASTYVNAPKRDFWAYDVFDGYYYFF
jgi:hypothetical protein